MVHPSQQRPNYSARRPSWSLTYRRGDTTRTYAIRPLVAVPAIGLFALLLTAYIGATAYLVYRDDLVGAAVSRQVSMQYAYEERIAALRSELDRLTSRHVVQTENVEQQLATLLEQQAMIERRQSEFSGIVARARAAGVDVAKVEIPIAAPVSENLPVDAGAAPLAYAPAEPTALDRITDVLTRPRTGDQVSSLGTNIRPLLSRVRASLDGTEAGLSQTLHTLGVAAQGEADRLSTALAPIGVGVGGPEDEESEPQGGPFIPTTGLHFVERTALLGRTLDDISSLRDAASVMPVGVPVKATRVSSRFGHRLDPFLKRPAFHAGLDFVAAAGSTVYATAPGTVVAAGRNGGYGRMVEVKHADGLSTRYGHLSAVLVTVGTKVAVGTPVGRVGSTGRSTGPHLHYETRRDGNAVNPSLYLAAGKALRGSS